VAGQKFKSNKAKGNEFESRFFNECHRQKIICKRLPDGCKRVFFRGRVKLIPVKTDFDYILSHAGRAAFVDIKAFDTNTLAHSQITNHQALALFDMQSEGHASGYIVYFTSEQQVRFYKASQLLSIKKYQSLALDQGLFLGDLEKPNLHSIFECVT
jgi:penicillin-binding protein-related factor A (putative recombinase)